MRNFESENKASVFIGIGIVPLLVPLYKGTTLTGPEGGIPGPGRSRSQASKRGTDQRADGLAARVSPDRINVVTVTNDVIAQACQDQLRSKPRYTI